MKRIVSILIVVLSLSLAVQNTCPFGKAGKTSVGPACGHCPLHQVHRSASFDGRPDLLPHSPVPFPAFILALEQHERPAVPAPLSPSPLRPELPYTDAVTDEPLHPPRS